MSGSFSLESAACRGGGSEAKQTFEKKVEDGKPDL